MAAKKLISVYGARLTGKTTVSEQLAERLPNAKSLNCNRPDTWDDKEWHQRLIDGAGDKPQEDIATEHIREVYKQAGSLLLKHDAVILDGDPVMKLMAQVVQKEPEKQYLWAAYRSRLLSATRAVIERAAPDTVRQYVHTTISNEGYFDYGARLSMDALSQDQGYDAAEQRMGQGAKYLMVYNDVTAHFENQGLEVAHVPTDLPYDPYELARRLQPDL
jgi:adenylate kinase family enzyme